MAGIVDEVVGPGPAGLPLTAGHLPGVGGAEPAGGPVFEGGVRGLVEVHRRGPVTKIGARALDHRRFWDAMHAVTAQQLERIGQTIALRLIEVSGVDVSSVALDMTNFATFITTATRRPRSRSGARRSRNAATCGWSGWAWWSPVTAEIR